MSETTEKNIANHTSADATSKSPNVTNGRVPVFLPTLEVQYICGYDIRPGFNTTDTFQYLYQSLLPDITEPQLTTTERISGMDQILKTYGKKKLDHWGCNTTSSEVLMTFKVKGFASFDRFSPDIVKMNEVINQASVRNFFEVVVCNDLSRFRVFVESPFRKESQSNDFNQVQHQVDVLCSGGGGGDYFKYNNEYDDDGDPIFVLFGIIVGYYMVRMIVSELKLYGRNRGRHRDGYPEYELVDMT